MYILDFRFYRVFQTENLYFKKLNPYKCYVLIIPFYYYFWLENQKLITWYTDRGKYCK